MPERLVRQSTRDRVPRHALDTALPTPRVVLDDAAFDRGPIRLDQLADGDEAELVEAAEHGQVRGRESRVEHVEVFRDGEHEQLPSSGRPRPLPGHRHAQPTTPTFMKSPVEHYISRVGAMPARLRPRWSVCTKRINPKGDLRKSLAVFTVWATIDKTIEPGRHLALHVPQPLPLDRELPDYELENRRGITKRYNSWIEKDQPGGPLPLVPYVLLGDGSVVLGKKTRVQPPPQCLAQVPLCTCGHAITQHALRHRTRLAPSMTAYGRCGECGCRRYAARE